MKQFRRELAQLQYTNLAFSGGDEARAKEADLIRNIEVLTPEATAKRKKREHGENWAWLASKKRG